MKPTTPTPGPAQIDTLETLEAAAWRGMTMSELATACGRRLENQEVVVHLLHKRGEVVFRVELSDTLRRSRRWWLAKYAPRPSSYVVTDPELVARHRTGTLADPWGVRGAARVVDSAQCRPWAMAAARLIESEAARG
jgi:hypothetical protein